MIPDPIPKWWPCWTSGGAIVPREYLVSSGPPCDVTKRVALVWNRTLFHARVKAKLAAIREGRDSW